MQSANEQAVRSVVTRLRSKRSKAEIAREPDFDLSELRAVIDELPTMDATKVVALHRRIVHGDYKVDVQRLSEKMIELESALDSD